MSLTGSTAAELLTRMQQGDSGCVEIVQAYLQQIKTKDGQIQAVLHCDEQSALEQAETIDLKRTAGKPLGKLAGLPIAIKDNMCTLTGPTTCASRMLENFHAPYDAHVITQLKSADAVLIAKTNLDEFAMGSSNENSAFQITRNPWNTDCAPGGSSGGSAAAVAAEMAPLALGSDTGGSIRQPAGFCGVVGMKPTYGRVSRYGLVAFASSLDQIGPLANDVHGSALLLETIAGHDARDATCVRLPVPDYTATLEQPIEGLKVGVVREHFADGLHDDVRKIMEQSLDLYKSIGAEIIDIELPHAKYAVAAYYIVAPSEASSNLARYDGVHYGHRAESFENMIDMYARSRGAGFGPEVKRRIMLGTYSLSSGYYDAYYLKALKVRRLIYNDYEQAFQKVDVIASPVAPTPAFKIGELIDDPLAMYLTDIYTLGANMAGLPGISVPAGLSQDGLPIGLQLLAPAFAEEAMLRAARMFESAANWRENKLN